MYGQTDLRQSAIASSFHPFGSLFLRPDFKPSPCSSETASQQSGATEASFLPGGSLIRVKGDDGTRITGHALSMYY